MWFLDGKNSEGKVISNPNIGYGSYTIHYTDRTTKEFYQIGLSANTSGISVYIMGIQIRHTYPKPMEKNSARQVWADIALSSKHWKILTWIYLKRQYDMGLRRVSGYIGCR
jgi:hypothetical protein